MPSIFTNTYRATSEINADPESVWAVLYNLDTYADWNPFTPKIETDWTIGSKVLLTVQMQTGRKLIRQTEYLQRLEPPLEVAWGVRWGPFLRAERIQRLSVSVEGGTTYLTEDRIQGPLSPLVHWLYGRDIQRGLEGVALGLKAYVEGE